jgi:hypothetical protein
MRRLLPLIVAAFVLLAPVPASACTCPSQTPEEKADRAKVVFTGRVIRLRETTDATIVARFRVRLVFKGKVTRRVNVTTPSAESVCGCSFRVGRRYTVFAYHPKDGGLATDICTGTRRGRIDHDRYGLPPATPP